MLIKCSKCGKMYDYEKYSGICPKCARYNRPDSREDMEQDLHERYDTYKDPRQHDWYRAGTEDAGEILIVHRIKNPHIAIRTKITANGREKRKKGRHQ